MKRNFKFNCKLRQTEFLVSARSVAEAKSRAKFAYAKHEGANQIRLQISLISDSEIHLELTKLESVYYAYLYKGFKDGVNTTYENDQLNQFTRVIEDLRSLK